jgi:PAS domain S-box-containing protein
MAPNDQKTLAMEIDANKAEIVRLWSIRLRESSAYPRPLPQPILLDSVPEWIDRLGQYFRQPDSPFKLQKLANRAREHGRQRADVRFDLDRVLFEYAILQQTILEVLERNEPLSPHHRNLILDAIQLSMRHAALEYIHTSSMQRSLETLGVEGLNRYQRYILTVAIVLFATIVQWIVWPSVQPFPYTLYYPAVTIASLYGNGSAAILLSAFVSQYLFVEPRFSFRFGNWHDLIRLLIFMASAYLISMVTNALRKERALSEVAVREQENARKAADEAAGLARVAHAESERRAAELRAVIESIPDGVYIGDINGITIANEPALEMVGTQSVSELSHRVSELIPVLKITDPETGRTLNSEEMPFTQALEGKSVSRDLMLRKLNSGAVICVRNAAAPIRQDGKILGAVAVNTDITEKKLSEAQLKDNLAALQLERDLREQFVLTLSHDLRSPLSAARSSAELLLKRWDQLPSREKVLRGLFYNLSRVDKMIRDLLDANRVRAGQGLPIELEECDLRAVVQTTLEDLALVNGDRFGFISPKEVVGHWSPDGLRRIIENLCGNAVKYGTENSKITVTIEPRDETILLSVHNVGNPIPEEEQARLFVHFRRADSAEKSSKKGWGLGLALVKGIAEAHGGRVAVRSSAAQGTTFIVEIPRDSRAFQKRAA